MDWVYTFGFQNQNTATVPFIEIKEEILVF
jgi:hypothetical protein